jgi:hypothetical protein
MYAAYQPRLITKASIMAASPLQLEMQAPHVILVKEPGVFDRFSPRFAPPLVSTPSILCSMHDKVNPGGGWIIS